MSHRNLSHMARCAWLILIAALTCWSTPAGAQLMRHLEFQELVSKADHIFVATCTSRTTEYRNRRIITTYKLKPSEFWKGQIKLNKDGQFEMQELGGAIEKPLPLAQHVDGMANIGDGEEVLLFTTEPRELIRVAGQPEPERVLSDSVRILGAAQGRYSVIRHPESGQPLVLRANSAAAPVNVNQNLRRGLSGEAKTTLEADAEKELGKQIDAAAEKSLRLQEQQAERWPTRVDDIRQFESLRSVKSRVQQALREASEKTGE